MQSKPEHFDSRYAEAFQAQQVVDAYRYRPPYPPEVFPLLASLIVDEPRVVLDVGSGSGDIARPLLEHVERVDAVDFSQNMLARGKLLPNGNNPQLRWIYGKVEEAELAPPYALITAGSSIHWPAWDVAFPRFQRMLTPNGFLALIYRRTLPMSWESEIRAIRAQFSDHRRRAGSNAIKELESRGFFRKQGEQEAAPIPFSQSLDDYIEGLHSRSAFTREQLGPQGTADFDRQVRELLLPLYPDGILPFQVVASVTWGKPEVGHAS